MISLIIITILSTTLILMSLKLLKLSKEFKKVNTEYNSFLKIADEELAKIQVKIKETADRNDMLKNDNYILFKEYKLAYNVITYLSEKYNFDPIEIANIVNHLEENKNNTTIKNLEENYDIDILLDKINKNGLNALNENEKIYLSKYNKHD